MKKTIKYNLKINLITLGLLFLIPITVNLGINFIYPKISWETFTHSQNFFMQENMPNYDTYQTMINNSNIQENTEQRAALFKEYNQYHAKWLDSNEYKALKKEQSDQQQFKFIMMIIVILLLMISINYIKLAMLSVSIMGSILYLFIFELNNWSFNFSSPIKEGLFLHIPLPILGIATSLICLALTIHYANKD